MLWLSLVEKGDPLQIRISLAFRQMVSSIRSVVFMKNPPLEIQAMAQGKELGCLDFADAWILPTINKIEI